MAKLQTQLHINCVGRVCVTVADTDRALDFYVGTLGFEKVVDVPMGPGMRWVEVQVGDAQTTIAIAPPPEGQQAGGSQTGIILYTSHVDADRRGPQGGRRRRGRRSDALRRPGAADVLVPRPRRQLPIIVEPTS